MVKVSFHGGHSSDYCDHASATKQLMAEAYLAAGFSHAALTEHLPPPADEFLYPDEIAKGHDAQFLQKRIAVLFGEEAPRLREAFRAKLHLLIGFETEWYGKQPAQNITRAIARFRPDIIVASVHHVSDIVIDGLPEDYQKAVQQAGGLDELYCRYYDQQLELISTLAPYTNSIPVVVGHMDLITMFSPDHEYGSEVRRRISRNIDAAVQVQMVFEINSRAFKKGLGRPYPAPAILQAISAAGGKITFSDDSHCPEDVGFCYREAQEAARRFFSVAAAFELVPGGYRTVELPL